MTRKFEISTKGRSAATPVGILIERVERVAGEQRDVEEARRNCRRVVGGKWEVRFGSDEIGQPVDFVVGDAVRDENQSCVCVSRDDDPPVDS